MKVDFETRDIGAPIRAPVSTPAASKPQPGAAEPLQFDLPPSLLRQLVAVAAGYLVVMGFAFREGTGIGLLFAIFGVVLVAYYGLPLVMARASGARADPSPKRGAWGIDTASGYLPGRAAAAQVMTVPLLMLAWALVVALLK